jgi:hypothetical protein
MIPFYAQAGLSVKMVRGLAVYKWTVVDTTLRFVGDALLGKPARSLRAA